MILQSIRKAPVLLLMIAIVAAGCSSVLPPAPSEAWLLPWTYTDLRALDAVDAPTASQDLLAVFLRSAGSEIQIRLDLLDLPVPSDADLYLALDSTPGGTTRLPISASSDIDWDALIIIPARGPIQTLASDFQERRNLAVRILRDPVQATLTISLNGDILPNPKFGYQLQVFLTPAGQPALADKSAPISSASPPPQRARVLLAFWNTFPAYTPAQTLRRWDGAHTGPQGERHGLYNLLRAAKSHSLPVALLDLKLPPALSALEYAGGLNLVKDLASRNLLILPDTVPVFPVEAPYRLPDWAVTKAAADSRKTALAFGLPASGFLYAPLPEQPSGLSLSVPRSYSVVFTPFNSTEPFPLTGVTRWGGKRVIYLPAASPEDGAPVQATNEGLSLEARRALVAAAMANNVTAGGPGSSILVLGGDLPRAGWGDPASARAAMDYLVAHPWIQILNSYDLLAEPATQGTFDPSQPQQAEALGGFDEVFSALSHAPANPLGEAAWQAALALLAPASPAPPELAALRSIYLRQVDALLDAAHWAEHPAPITQCGTGLDANGEAECVFANSTFYTLINLSDGSLTYAFAITKSGAHQIIGPFSQFETGLGDPTTWDLSRGLHADPSLIQGAFADQNGPYQASESAGQLVLTNQAGVQKTFTLKPEGVRVAYRADPPANTEVPLAVDPWMRFDPRWEFRYTGVQNPASWIWSVSSDISVKVMTSGRITSYQFLDTRDRMGLEEDPNFDYPPGHFLPFPLSLAEINGQGNLFVEIQVQSSLAQ